ncbi:MAG: methyl-accepting chemotaxis protein [Pseudomonadota bacterium]
MIKSGAEKGDVDIVLIGALAAIPLVLAAAAIAGNGFAVAGGISAVSAGLALWAARGGASANRPLLGVALIGQCIALTAALAGTSWQIDSHMVFFAALAILVVLRDVRAIIAATAAIALHHLSLTFVMPSLVYPSIDVAENVFRTGFHAVVVLLEAGLLIVAIARQNALIADVEAKELSEAELNQQRTAAMDAIEQVSAAQKAAIVALDDALKSLAEKDLSVRLDDDLSAEYEPLRRHFNETAEQLQTMIAEIAARAQAIRDDACGFGEGARDLSKRTEDQATTLVETSEALRKVASSIGATAENASKTQSFMEKSQKSATDSGALLDKTVTAIREIERSSESVLKINDVIDDIAFQTNLLALNAGVEAARAGEAGRGFAVVASEVRALAQRTTESAFEIRELISQSEGQVRNGVVLVNQTVQSLDSMTATMGETASLIGEINRSARDQSIGIEQINGAVERLDDGGRRNAAMAEETTAAATKLLDLADELRDQTARFSLSDEHAQTGAERSPGGRARAA